MPLLESVVGSGIKISIPMPIKLHCFGIKESMSKQDFRTIQTNRLKEPVDILQVGFMSKPMRLGLESNRIGLSQAHLEITTLRQY